MAAVAKAWRSFGSGNTIRAVAAIAFVLIAAIAWWFIAGGQAAPVRVHLPPVQMSQSIFSAPAAPNAGQAPSAMAGGKSKAAAVTLGPINPTKEPLFIVEIVLLLVVGRTLGEVMRRFGQPAVMGQLIAGIILGHSVLGALWPHAEKMLFPSAPDQKGMIDAISQLGILLLLMLTGMETDLKLVRRVGKAAIAISLTGIAVPFICGFALGQFLPDSLVPGGNRVVTALFLGTAMSISSIKIVAMVVREMDFMRRNLGQIIVASAIMEDSIGWIIIAITLGIASHGKPDLLTLAKTIGGITIFLAFSFTIGRRIVFWLIRWTNDNLKSEFAVITMILVIMGVMALITSSFGVQTVLGAFIAGVLIGESPILTEHIDEQLRGMIVALFMPVFFGLSGLSADLTILKDPTLLMLTGGLFLIASVGKFTGAFIGGKIGGLTGRESLALGCGMNARGSTEVIVASIGLAMGALTQNLFTMIVTMAVVTTMLMPPMLRKALANVPMRAEEKKRLEREALDEKGFIPNLERLLLAVDESVPGKITSRIAGLIAGGRGMPITIVPLEKKPEKPNGGPKQMKPDDSHERMIKDGAEASANAAAEVTDEEKPRKVEIERREKGETPEKRVAEAATKGFDMMLIGIDKARTKDGEFGKDVARIIGDFDGPLAVFVCSDCPDPAFLDEQSATILVPVNGSAFSRNGAETAFAIALPTRSAVTALYVSATAAQEGGRRRSRRSLTRRNEEAVLKDIAKLGERYDIDLKTDIAPNRSAEIPIREEAANHDLVVMGVNRRPGKTLFFGNTAAELMKEWDGPILFIAS
jgi:Kef-type K+ transport system membrane component KefB/nucleotide-binding universal stress UspA family protein